MFSEVAKSILANTPLGLFPVRVRKGLAKGARWTLGPFSAYWRNGGSEEDVYAAASLAGDLRGKVFWDFGAHFGIHSVGMGFQVGPTGQVASFEPDPVAYARLYRHLAMNSLTQVRAFEAAASDHDGQATLFVLGGGGTATSHLKFHDWDDAPEGEPTKKVRTVRPDTLVANRSIRLPDILKIDVQGHGGEAIAGSADSIRESLPIIAYSNHSDREINGVMAVLAPLGYQPYNFAGQKLGWHDVTECLLIHPKRAPSLGV